MNDPAKTTRIRSGTTGNDAFDDLIETGKRPQTPRDFGGGALQRKSISEQVADRIMGMIKSGNLKSGDQLPTEQQMCVAFGISRPPLREALKALTMMGVLGSRQGGRYTVTDLSASRLVEPFNMLLSATHYKVHEHFEARAVVDLELVRLCTLRASDEMRARIVKLARDGRAFHDDPVAFRLLDIEFHQSINNGAGNAMLSALAQSLYDVALDVRRAASEMPGVIEKSVIQHCKVADAILVRNAPAAVAAYREHLEHVRDTTIQSSARMAQ
jgi:GntR family transcriptional regulator, L-lactate dehydrogenase operon regulator